MEEVMDDASDNVDYLDDFPFDAELPIFDLHLEHISLPEIFKLEGY